MNNLEVDSELAFVVSYRNLFNVALSDGKVERVVNVYVFK